MQFQSRQSKELRMDITPMIDVIFLLLLFFIMATIFESTPSLKVELPDSKKADATPLVQPIQIVLTKTGKIYLGDEQISAQSLVAILSRLPNSAKATPLVIQAAGEARHEDVVFVMDAAKRSGFERLSIATKRNN